MSTRSIGLFLAAGFLLMLPSYSSAQDSAQGLNPYSVGLSAGAAFTERDEEIETGQGLYELKGAYNFDPEWTIEGTFGYLPFLNANQAADTRYALDDDTWGLKFAVDAMYHLDGDPGRTIDPYLTFGGGLMYYDAKLENDQHWDPFFGPGLGVGVPLTDNVSLRGDYRYVVAGHDTESNHHVTVALGYSWGADELAGGGQGKGDAGMGGEGLIADLHIIYFAFDSAELTNEAKTKLQQNAQWLKDHADVNIVLEGHCDERGTNEYNMALGERRAKSAYNYLRSLGVPAERLATVSLGEERPADAGHNEAAWAKNRRVQCVGAGK